MSYEGVSNDYPYIDNKGPYRPRPVAEQNTKLFQRAEAQKLSDSNAAFNMSNYTQNVLRVNPYANRRPLIPNIQMDLRELPARSDSLGATPSHIPIYGREAVKEKSLGQDADFPRESPQKRKPTPYSNVMDRRHIRSVAYQQLAHPYSIAPRYAVNSYKPTQSKLIPTLPQSSQYFINISNNAHVINSVAAPDYGPPQIAVRFQGVPTPELRSESGSGPGPGPESVPNPIHVPVSAPEPNPISGPNLHPNPSPASMAGGGVESMLDRDTEAKLKRGSSVSSGASSRSYTYKPYTLKDYRDIKPQRYFALGGLGANIGSIEWQIRKTKLDRMHEFARSAHQLNRIRLSQTATRPLPMHPKTPEQEMATRMREKMEEYSQTVIHARRYGNWRINKSMRTDNPNSSFDLEHL